MGVVTKHKKRKSLEIFLYVLLSPIKANTMNTADVVILVIFVLLLVLVILALVRFMRRNHAEHARYELQTRTRTLDESRSRLLSEDGER